LDVPHEKKHWLALLDMQIAEAEKICHCNVSNPGNKSVDVSRPDQPVKG
jgi:hypothetical protein